MGRRDEPRRRNRGLWIEPLGADSGVRGLVIKLEQELAEIESDGPRLVCGGGARLPQVSARAAKLGLSGIEFGVNIPGTVGGAVRMNANAYGGELQRVLEWVDVCTLAAPSADRPSGWASPTGAPTWSPARSSRAHRSCSTPGDAAAIKAELADMRARRKARSRRASRPSARPSRTPTTHAPKGAPRASCSRRPAAAASSVGGARFSPKHANFVENRGDATTADVLELMAEGRRRVRERFGIGLEAEVQLLGDVDLPPELRRTGQRRSGRAQRDTRQALRPDRDDRRRGRGRLGRLHVGARSLVAEGQGRHDRGCQRPRGRTDQARPDRDRLAA